MAKTLDDLRTAVRQRADIEGSSQRFPDLELTSYINQSAAELYDLLTDVYEDYFTTPVPLTFALTSASNRYALPADFFKIRGVDYSLTPTEWVEVDTYALKDRNLYQTNPVTLIAPYRAYMLVANTLVFQPAADASGTYRLWYVPTFADLVAEDDLLTVPQNWDEYVIVDAAAKCYVKDEADASALYGAKQALRERIQRSAPNRDAGTPKRVLDVRRDEDDGARRWWAR